MACGRPDKFFRTRHESCIKSRDYAVRRRRMAHAITSMKSSIVLLSSFFFCSCANMFVTSSTVGGAGAGAPTDTKDFASSGIHMVTNCGVGASAPKAIYIRPFCIDTAAFKGDQTD